MRDRPKFGTKSPSFNGLSQFDTRSTKGFQLCIFGMNLVAQLYVPESVR